METGYTVNSIFHIAKADFLERVRSYYFLIALGACVFLIYSFVPPLDAGYRMVTLGNYRGFYNSAWIGSMVSMCVPFFALVGFYVVSNAVQRDITTGVGQIIATTRITRLQYLTGKLISNFAVLLLMLLVIAAMTVVMFLVRGETSHLEPGKLLLPLLLLTAPAMFILASVALFFDALPGVGRGFVNIAYFFLWTVLVSASLWTPASDVLGVNTCMLEITNAVSVVHPDWNGQSGTGIMITDQVAACKVFTWQGMNWTSTIFLYRIFWMVMAFGLVLAASVFFNRFDTPEVRERRERSTWFRKKKSAAFKGDAIAIGARYRDLPEMQAGFSFAGLVKAELRLMTRGKSNLWMIVTAGLFIASAFAPLGIALKYILPLLWFFQVLILSKLGSREITHRCNEYIFSAAFPLQRQLPATLSAAALITISLALPVFVRVLAGGNFYGAYAILAGALFVPAFAVASGILTGGSKLFEVLFTVMVYGMLNGAPFFDLTGAIKESHTMGVAHYLLGITAILLLVAFSGRKRQIR
ncbi:MAG: hypothetical protein NT040_02315 [Bacteroidetes bacterium]|nr:hypothetical protein [Bacteroidota bacterium]